ncbi:SDR family NAD(P)-dependent oxidoreductase [Bordetella tumulicola]|uniref:SDR family NAD(P)-dependent oxidoreductase n=1 Tax=Bordetella tumulicola TaxID=1649133 RepID=UPI0039EE0E2F
MSTQSVFVVGGASGIGLEAARYFVDQGVATTIVDVDDAKLRQAERALARPGARLLALAADVRDRASVDQAFATGAARHGDIDALIYTAGVLLPATLADMTESDYDLTFDVNTKGFWRCVQAAMPRFAGQGGSIVAVSSSSGQRPKAGNGAYAASKVALQFLVRALALETAPRQIRVNCVCPSMLKTPLTDKLLADPTRGSFPLSATTPLGRLCTEADVVQAIAFLCTPQAAFITGTAIAVDGGATAGVPLKP